MMINWIETATADGGGAEEYSFNKHKRTKTLSMPLTELRVVFCVCGVRAGAKEMPGHPSSVTVRKAPSSVATPSSASSASYALVHAGTAPLSQEKRESELEI